MSDGMAVYDGVDMDGICDGPDCSMGFWGCLNRVDSSDGRFHCASSLFLRRADIHFSCRRLPEFEIVYTTPPLHQSSQH